MLVLTRKIQETIVISDNIKITILGVRGCVVRIGIEAPKDVRIMREEIMYAYPENKCVLCGSDSHGNNSKCQI